jgi:hypothetical protein
LVDDGQLKNVFLGFVFVYFAMDFAAFSAFSAFLVSEMVWLVSIALGLGILGHPSPDRL